MKRCAFSQSVVLLTSNNAVVLFWGTLCCPNVISPMGNSGRFPQGKSAAAVSLYPTLIIINYKAHVGSVHVSIIHQTLTWTMNA